MSQRAPERPSNERVSISSYAVLVVAALSIVFSPSVYKGGAEHAHPHGFFEFWGSNAESTFDHHGHRHSHVTPHESAPAHPSAPRAPIDGQAAIAASSTVATPEDLPTLSTAVIPGGVAGAMAVALSMLVFLHLASTRRFTYPSLRQVLAGRVIAPESPPPRAATWPL